MCGFAGFLQPGGFGAAEGTDRVRAMGGQLVHRGPDDSGEWIDGDAGIALAHRRLSVVDLSSAGHQPMVSAAGRFVLAFNGEIYNHADLRRGLRHREWRGTSDTETLLVAIETWGMHETLRRASGMFAFAVWDRHDGLLMLARDRLGEKPLYCGWQGRTFLFGSELKALRSHPAFEHRLDPAALELYLGSGYITAPHSIYAGIGKLQPGTWLTIPGHVRPGETPVAQAYWSLVEAAEKGLAEPFQGTLAEAADELEHRLSTAVRAQLMADVPLGAFLSGGIDSSAVVALMQAQVDQPVRTFTIGFSEREYDESGYADAIARHLGTSHTRLHVTPEEARAVIPSLSHHYDEPFGDSSAIPTVLVSRLARSAVTVALSGDGGDELFGGYGRYPMVLSLWQQSRRMPRPIRHVAALATLASPPALLNALLGPLISLRGRRPSQPPALRAQRLAHALACVRGLDFYSAVIAQWLPAPLSTRGSRRTAGAAAHVPAQLGLREQMMLLDSLTYLPDDILVKVDRASMSISLETRVPMLDPRVVEFAWTLPPELRGGAGTGKVILREVLRRHVPPDLFERPKMGFGVPVDQWIRGPLREWADDLLAPDTLKRQHVLDARTVHRRWSEHRSGLYDWRDPIWAVLMLQAWLQSMDQRVTVAA